MTTPLVFTCNRASASVVAWHLQQCADAFVPPLQTRVDIGAYAEKIVQHAVCFEAYAGDVLVGLVAAYLNAQDRLVAFITSVSVLASHQGQGIGVSLLIACLQRVQEMGFSRVELEVSQRNVAAIALYTKLGFMQVSMPDGGDAQRMVVSLKHWHSVGGPLSAV